MFNLSILTIKHKINPPKIPHRESLFTNIVCVQNCCNDAVNDLPDLCIPAHDLALQGNLNKILESYKYKRIFKKLSIQRWKYPIHNVTLKALSDQV